MGSRTFTTGRVVAARLPFGSDLFAALADLAREHGLTVASVTAIGALSSARVAFYDQKTKVYTESAVDEPVEIASCVGTVSRRDGAAAVHAHVSLSREDGTTVGGHLVAGCTVFACEVVLTELCGDSLDRAYDEVTGLPLWQGL